MKRYLALAGRLGFPEASPARWVAFAVLAVSLFLLTGVLALSARDGQDPTNFAQSLVAWVYRTFGLSGTIFGFLLVILWAARIFLSGQVPRLGIKAIGVAGVVVSICGLSGTVAYEPAGTVAVGTLGHAIAEGLVPLFSRGACVVVFTTMLIGSLLLATNWFFLEEFRALAIQQARKGVEGQATAAAGIEAEAEFESEQVTPPEERAILLSSPAGAALATSADREWGDPSDAGVDPGEEFEFSEAATVVAEQEPGVEEDPEGAQLEEEFVKGQGLLWGEASAGDGEDSESVTAVTQERLEAHQEQAQEAAREEPEPAATEPVKFAPGAEGQAASEPAVEIPRPERALPLPTPALTSGAPQIPVDQELLDRAVPLIIESGRATASILQRKLQIRPDQAARVMEDLERAGVVGPSRGSLPREILVTREQWERERALDRP